VCFYLWKAAGQENGNLKIRKREFGWIGYTLKKMMEKYRRPPLQWNPQGNRKTGRPRNSWRRSVIEATERSLNELRFLAADRKKWVELVDNLIAAMDSCRFMSEMFSAICW
jgi:hypothetical protein